MMKLLTHKTVFFLVILVSLCVKSPYSAAEEQEQEQENNLEGNEEEQKQEDNQETEEIEDENEEQEQENNLEGNEEEQKQENNQETEEIKVKSKFSRRYRKKDKKKGQTTEQENNLEGNEEEQKQENNQETEEIKVKSKFSRRYRKEDKKKGQTTEQEIANEDGEDNSKNISSGRSNNTQKNEIIYRKENTSQRKGKLLNNIRRPIGLQPSKNMHGNNKQNSISNKNLQEDDNDYYDEGSEGEGVTEEIFKDSNNGDLYILKKNKNKLCDLAHIEDGKISPVSEEVMWPGKEGKVFCKCKNGNTLELMRTGYQIEWSKIIKIKEKYVTLRKFVDEDGKLYYAAHDCKTGKSIELDGPAEVENENDTTFWFQINGEKFTYQIKSKNKITNRMIKLDQERLEVEKYIICDLGVNKNNLGIFLSKVKGSNPTKIVALYAVNGYRDDFEKRKRYILCKYFLFAVKPICSFLWAGANGFLHFEEINFNKMYFLKYIVCVGYRWQPAPMAKFGLFLDINISVPSVVHSIISTILKYKIEKFSITSKWKWFLGNIIFYSIPNCFNLNINFKIKNSYIAINFAGIIAELLRNIVIPNVGRYGLPNKRISSEQQQEEEEQKEEQKKELSQEEANEQEVPEQLSEEEEGDKQKDIEHIKNNENANINNMNPNINNKNLNINNKNLNINKNLNNNMIPNINMNPNNNKENENINKEDLNQQDNAQGGGSVVSNQASGV